MEETLAYSLEALNFLKFRRGTPLELPKPTSLLSLVSFHNPTEQNGQCHGPYRLIAT